MLVNMRKVSCFPRTNNRGSSFLPHAGVLKLSFKWLLSMNANSYHDNNVGTETPCYRQEVVKQYACGTITIMAAILMFDLPVPTRESHQRESDGNRGRES